VLPLIQQNDKDMATQIETLKKMQEIEMEAGFPNGELYNELQDRISIIEIESDKKRRFTTNNNLDFADKSNPIHY